MTQRNRDQLIEDLLMVRSRIDDAYGMEPLDEDWVKYLQELQSMIYKQLSAASKKDEEEE